VATDIFYAAQLFSEYAITQFPTQLLGKEFIRLLREFFRALDEQEEDIISIEWDKFKMVMENGLEPDGEGDLLDVKVLRITLPINKKQLSVSEMEEKIRGLVTTQRKTETSDGSMGSDGRGFSA